MKIVIDMNLSPAWVDVLSQAGHEAVHWSAVGSCGAPDKDILAWAKINRYVLFSHDLDFGAILAATDAIAPSVVQIRTENPVPTCCAQLVADVLSRYAKDLAQGCLISVDENRARVRILPLCAS